MHEENRLKLNLNQQSRLHISIIQQQQAWEKAQKYSNGIARYNAYLNYIALQAVYDWLTYSLEGESSLSLDFFPREEDLPSMWEFVNGSAIQIGKQRIIIIPTEIEDLTAISVPQEWVDIPDWIGDYYLAVKVDLADDIDTCVLNVRGLTTHRQLKHLADYNQRDRTYILPTEQLTENMREMQLVLGLEMREPVKEIPNLSNLEANNLLKILSDSSIYSPRLQDNIPFTKWAAFISSHQWRNQLYQQRFLGITDIEAIEKAAAVNNLNQWLENIFTGGWQSLESIINSSSGNLVFNFRNHQIAINHHLSITGIKLIDIGLELNHQPLALLVGLTPETDTEVAIRVQLHPTNGKTYLPDNAKLALLSPTDIILQEVTSRTQDNLIQLKRFTCQRGKSFQIRVIFQEFSLTEAFTIESIQNINHSVSHSNQVDFKTSSPTPLLNQDRGDEA